MIINQDPHPVQIEGNYIKMAGNTTTVSWTSAGLQNKLGR